MLDRLILRMVSCTKFYYIKFNWCHKKDEFFDLIFIAIFLMIAKNLENIENGIILYNNKDFLLFLILC